MAVRRLFIVWSHPLFHETVRAILNHPGIEIVGGGSERAAVQADIKRFQPDLIIVEETEDAPNAAASALEILEASSWGARVFRLSLQDNELRVYQREQRTVSQPEDLLSLILDT